MVAAAFELVLTVRVEAPRLIALFEAEVPLKDVAAVLAIASVAVLSSVIVLRNSMPWPPPTVRVLPLVLAPRSTALPTWTGPEARSVAEPLRARLRPPGPRAPAPAITS